MKWINYHHLIYFKEIATQGSISKASEILKVGQPALSSQLKNLEEYLGVDLFERRNRRLFLTEAGQVALEYADKISNLGQELINVIDDRSFTKKLTLTVGALDSIPKHLIFDLVNVSQNIGDIKVTVLEDSIESLTREMLAHQVDIIIADHTLTSGDQKNIFCKRIIKVPIHAYASKKYKFLKKNFPQSLEGQPLSIPTRHSKLRHDLDHFFHLQNIRPNIVSVTQDTSLQKLFATRGHGVIFLPEFAAKEYIKHQQLIEIGKMDAVFVIFGPHFPET